MTLYINVTEIDKLKNVLISIFQGGVLFVEGSRAGLLSTQKISSSHRFNPPFLIKCASDDILNFKVAKNIQAYETGDILAQGTLSAPALIKRYKYEFIGPS